MRDRTDSLLFYYITNRAQFPGTEFQRLERLLAKISEAALAGVDYIQLREKDLSGRALESLAEQAAQLIRDSRNSTHLLINSRTDVALAATADGVHLTSNDISPVDVRKIWRETRPTEPIIAVSCHSEADVITAKSESANFVVFGPVFEKPGATKSAGIDQLQQVCRHQISVLALGGVTTENAHVCIAAGASGIAGIRLFQENDVARVVKKLRGLK
jgi:thiamine-phosphate pyrophosphorylase